MNEDQFFKLIPYITWPVAIGFVAYFARPLWPAIAAWVRSTTDNKKIDDLYLFKETAENNHFTDLDRLIKSDDRQWRLIEQIQADLTKQGNDIAYIKGRLNGHLHE